MVGGSAGRRLIGCGKVGGVVRWLLGVERETGGCVEE